MVVYLQTLSEPCPSREFTRGRRAWFSWFTWWTWFVKSYYSFQSFKSRFWQLIMFISLIP